MKQEKVCDSPGVSTTHILGGEKRTHHRLVAARHALVVRQRKVVDKERADDDDGRGKDDTGGDVPANDRLVLLRGGLRIVVVDGVDTWSLGCTQTSTVCVMREM